MNWDQIEGQWNDLKGIAREKWGKITDDEWTVIAGKKDRLLAKLQVRYGKKKDEAEAELDEFISKVTQPKKNPKEAL